MRIEFDNDPGLQSVLIVRPAGRLDAGRLREDRPSVLLDMRKVESVSSAGVGILIRLLTRVQGMEGSLAVFGCSSRVCAILDVVNLRAVLKVSEDEEEARGKLAALGVS